MNQVRISSPLILLPESFSDFFSRGKMARISMKVEMPQIQEYFNMKVQRVPKLPVLVWIK